jgi:hypothetical protein
MPIAAHAVAQTGTRDHAAAACAAVARSAALRALLDAVRTRRAEFATQQRISDDVVELMKASGVYRATVARRFGGDEVSPAEFLRLIETISMADGSAGWVASFGVSAIYLAALPLATLESIYAHGPDVVFAGGIFPPQRAIPVEGGLEVSGRWSCSEGRRGRHAGGAARWLGGPATAKGSAPKPAGGPNSPSKPRGAG